MKHLHWQVTFILLIGFSACILGARSFGFMQPAHPALRGFTTSCMDHLPLCWYGITPGQTTLGAARTTLEQRGYHQAQSEVELQDFLIVYAAPDQSPGCVDVFYGRELGYVGVLMLHCLELRAGDVAALIGVPPQWRQPQAGIVEWHYDRFIVQFAYGWQSSLYAPVQHIRLLNETIPNQMRFFWRGFLPHWKYCQYESHLTGCTS